MRSMVEGAAAASLSAAGLCGPSRRPKTEAAAAPSTAFGGSPPPRFAHGRIEALLAAALLMAVGVSLPAGAEERSKDGDMAVTVVRAARHCFTNRVAASGTFSARHLVEMRPDREGLVVTDVLVEPGDTVAKDQPLARLVSPQAPDKPIDLEAPVPGTVVATGAIIGAYASPKEGDPLFRIAENGEVELDGEVLGTSVSRLRKGMAARIRVVGLGDIDGRIASIADGVDAQTQLGTLRLSVASDPRLRIGGFARAEIDAGQDCGLTVPLSALLFGAEGAVVGTVQSDRAIMRKVVTGVIEGGNVEIRDGLSEEDLVIAKAGPFLREGDPVRSVQDTR